MKKLMEGWEKFWFEGHGSLAKENLGLFRICYYLLLIPVFHFSMTHSLGNFDELFYQPVVLFKVFSPIHESVTAFELSVSFFYFFAFLSAIGFATPVTNKMVVFCAFYAHAPLQNYGGYQHLGSTFIMSMLIMAFARSNHAYSIDAWIGKKFNIAWMKMDAPDHEYIWPLKLIKFVLCFIFFSSAFLKIYTSGTEWLKFNMLGIFLKRFDFLYRHNMPNAFSTAVRAFISEHYWIGRMGTLLALVLEFSMPVILFYRKSVIPMLIAAAIFLILMMVMMGHHFWYTLSPYFLGILFVQYNIAEKVIPYLKRFEK